MRADSEFLMLHETLAIPTPSNKEELRGEVIERATRVLGTRRIALIAKFDGEEYIILFGFRGRDEAKRAISEAEVVCPENVFIHRFDGGVLYLEHSRKISEERRYFRLFSKRVEELVRHLVLEKRRLDLEKKEILLRSIPDPVIVVSLEGVLEDCNDAWVSSSGCSRSEIVGRKMYDIPCFNDESKARLAEMAGKWNQKFDLILTSRGEKKYFEVNPARIEDSKNFILICRDVTEFRELTSKFWRTADLLETLVDSMPDIVYFKDGSGRNVIVNKTFAKFLGKSKEDLMGKRDDEILPPYLAAQCKESDELAMAKGGVVRVEETGYVNGRKHVFETLKAPVYDKNGEFVGIIGISRDVTERIRIEELRRFRTLMDYSNDAILLVDADSGRIVDANLTACQWLRYAKNELLERKVTAVMEVSTWDVQTLEGWHIRKDGSKFPISVSLKEGELEGKRYLVIISRDITRLKEAEERIRRMNKHLSLINKILRHDLKNNATIICGYLDLYRESGDKELLDKIEKRLELCSELIDTVREVEEAILSGEGLSTVNLSEILEREVEKIKDKVSINAVIPENITVRADDMLSSVFENILLNSVFHNDKEEKKVWVTVNRKDGWVEVRIADNGPGIPDDIKKEIFEEGFKGERTGRTGLGLYLVKTLMEKYGGSVSVEDNEPEGSVFILRFPRGLSHA